VPYLAQGSLTGVDLAQYDFALVKDRAALRSELGIAPDDFVYGFFARKSISKGIEFLLESFAKVSHLPGAKLFMVGMDESEGKLEELLLKFKNISPQIVNIERAINHERYLSVCDVLCSPSSSEGFGSIVVEAAAMAIPTVGFKVLGLTDSVAADQSGLLVPYGDIDCLAAALELLYTDHEVFENMRINAKDRAIKYFSADYLYQAQKEFYEKYLNKSHSA
jgi:glycosyltransferase involved in cell wall biosynthesis